MRLLSGTLLSFSLEQTDTNIFGPFACYDDVLLSSVKSIWSNFI